MASTLTWRQLRDLDVAGIEEAADGWAGASNRSGSARDRVDSEMLAKLKGSQEGEGARAAVRRLGRLSENFHYIHVECGLARTVLDGLAHELKGFQKKLRDALDDAEALKFTVHADGTVSYPSAGEGVDGVKPPGGTVTGSHDLLKPTTDPSLKLPDRNPNRARAQEIADRIARVMRDARTADGDYAEAIRRLRTKPGIEVSDAMWADAHRDSAIARDAAYDYLGKEIPRDLTPAQRKEWWEELGKEEREQYLTLHPREIGSLDGIPAEVRDSANRTYLPLLMGKLEGEGTESAKIRNRTPTSAPSSPTGPTLSPPRSTGESQIGSGSTDGAGSLQLRDRKGNGEERGRIGHEHAGSGRGSRQDRQQHHAGRQAARRMGPQRLVRKLLRHLRRGHQDRVGHPACSRPDRHLRRAERELPRCPGTPLEEPRIRDHQRTEPP
ncbi:hypothetical protein ACLIYP_08680 [Streptomyces nanhaiensis]|uniref:hypothetical protein n=1 Tax=Streptomyces nanhaiensis TaxID=679319 RepID=UPI00399D0069